MARTKAKAQSRRRKRRSRSISSKTSESTNQDGRTLEQKACDCVRKVRTSVVIRSLTRVLKSKNKSKKALATNSRALSLKKRKSLRSAPYGICTKSVYGTRNRKGPGRYNCKTYDRKRWTVDGLRALLYLKDIPYKEKDSKNVLLEKLQKNE